MATTLIQRTETIYLAEDKSRNISIKFCQNICKEIAIDANFHFSNQSKKISNDQELIQSDPISCPQNQKGNN